MLLFMGLCTNSLQVGGDSELCTFLQEIVDGQLDLRDSQNHQHLKKLQQKVPIIASFLTGLSKPPVQVYNVLLWTCCSHWCNIPTCRCHDPNPPPSDNPSPLRYFPSLPELRAPSRYEADLQLLAKETAPVESCHMATQLYLLVSSPSIACQHGVCYGYEVMAQCESPKILFQIFITHFPQPPHVIVYDNGWKLHVYCLNQEAGYFQNTLFLLDRFHWRRHTGCSSGYNLDLYAWRAATQDTELTGQWTS